MVLSGRLYRGATSAAAELGHTMIGLDLTDGAPADPGDFPQPGSLERAGVRPRARPARRRAARAHPKSFLGRRLAAGRARSPGTTSSTARSEGDEPRAAT